MTNNPNAPREAQQVNEQGEDAGNWLECLPWDGQEASLPAGGNVTVPGLQFRKLVYRVEVLDAEVEEGSRFIPQSELSPDDVIIGAKLNENSIKRIEANYGPDWIRIADPNGGRQVNRMQWREKHGTDGLALLAIRDLRYGQPVTSVGAKPTQGQQKAQPTPAPAKPKYPSAQELAAQQKK